MKVSDAGLRFIAAHEGVVLHVYLDPVGYPTIGVGHLITAADAGKDWSRFSYEDAISLLATDAEVAARAIRDTVWVDLEQHQFDALASFVFNVGGGAFASSTLLSLLNGGDYQGAADQLLRWVYANGYVLPGLLTRRQEEHALFLNGDYGFEVPASQETAVPTITPTPWAAVVKAGTADFDTAFQTFHLGFGMPVLDSRDAKLADPARPVKGAVYLGQADLPAEPWKRHDYAIQLSGAGLDRTRALVDLVAVALRAAGLPK